MKKLIICCDGTWNNADDREQGVPTPTNVARLYNAVTDEHNGNRDQRKYYHSGVGTERHWWQRVAGGALGVGLEKHIMSAYRWLGEHYEDGAALYVFGFSRGAFTARSLVGMMSAVGLLDLRSLTDEQAWPRVEDAYYKGYQNRESNWHQDWSMYNNGDAIAVRFVGVWDTVGALGIPNDLAILNLFDNPNRYAFLDTTLGDHVEVARQAIALDEHRASFTPTLWTEIPPGRDVKQLWFPGVHSDVGGGYLQTGLADGALLWMMEEAEQAGLAIDPKMKVQLKPDYHGVLHDSATGIFGRLRTQPRSAPPLTDTSSFHQSAINRHQDPHISQAPYWPTVLLQPGEEKTVSIFALQHWNATGLYLEAGARYACHASGQWMNGDEKCGPDGAEQEGSIVDKIKQGTHHLADKFEDWYREKVHSEQADIIGTRREEAIPLGALAGAIANGGNPGTDGSPEPHEIFLIGSDIEYPDANDGPITAPGYLYCFMNDAWHFYSNNKGSVSLTIKRLS